MTYVPLFVAYSEEGCDLVKGFVFRLGNFAICENPKKSQEHAKGEEGVVLQGRLHGGEAYAYKEVGTPVHQDGHAHGGRPRSLREQFSRDHPWNGTGTDGEEDHVE